MGKIFAGSTSFIETAYVKDRVNGDKCYIRIDQSTNISTSEGDAAILLNGMQVRDLIAFLNDYIIYTEGKPYVVLAEPLLSPEVKIIIEGKEIQKKPEDVNPYLIVEEILTPGEQYIDYDDYFNSISPKKSQ